MCFSPGPNNVLCAAHGSQHGFRGTLILISGMAFGWSALGLFVAVATDLIEENQAVFDLLTYVGAAYIAYLSYKIATSNTIEQNEVASERLGFMTGATIPGSYIEADTDAAEAGAVEADEAPCCGSCCC